MKPGDLAICDLDNFDHGFPHAYFEVLRREDPIHREPEPDGSGFWAVTRHADVIHISRNPRLFSSWEGGTNIRDAEAEEIEQLRSMMLNMDPPQHVKYRRLVQKAFTPRVVARLEPKIRSEARGVVDRVAEKGECDFVRDIASELPLILICELMGVPAEDRRLIFEWSNQLIGFDDPEYQHSPDDGRKAAAELWMYAHRIADEKRSRPDETLLSRLVNGQVDGHQLSELEFNNFAVLLAVAGNETTRTMTTHGMRLLFENPEQRARLQGDVERLLPSAVEEMLRMSPPVLHFRRTATADTEIRGRRIRRGEKVVMFYPSANRDEEVFEDPNRFDVTRQPNHHLSFGIGEHYCLGANLARMTLHSIFREILTRLPDLEPAGEIRRLRGNFVDGVKAMPVRFTPED